MYIYGIGTRGVDDFPSFQNINKVFSAVQIPHHGRQTWGQWLNVTEKPKVSDIILHCHIEVWSKWLLFWKRGFAQEPETPIPWECKAMTYFANICMRQYSWMGKPHLFSSDFPFILSAMENADFKQGNLPGWCTYHTMKSFNNVNDIFVYECDLCAACMVLTNYGNAW